MEAISLAAEAPRDKFLAAFAPFDGGPVSISPDGQHIAYARREKGEAAVYIATINGSQIAFRAVVGKEDRKRVVGETGVTDPVRVNFLRWADNRHVVVATSYDCFLSLDYQSKTGRHLIDLNGPEERRTGRVLALRRSESALAVIEVTSYTTGGNISHVILQVDVATGNAETVFDDEVHGRLIYDSSGRVRARYEAGYTIQPVFLLTSDGSKKKWQQLDQLHAAGSTLISTNAPEVFFGPRAFPVAIEQDTLYFASNAARSNFGLYALDLKTGKRTPFSLESATADLASPRLAPSHENVIVDRVSQNVVGFRVNEMQAPTRWIDPELAAVCEAVKKHTRGYSVDLVDWDDARERFVVELHNRTDPGAYYLFTRSAQKLEILLPRRTPHKALIKVQSTVWSQTRPNGDRLTGWLSLPEAKEQRPRPVVVRLNPFPWYRPYHEFHREVMALAQMGFAVLDIFPRGSDGLGLAHLQAGRRQFDTATTKDIIAALDGLPADAGIDVTRVALFGEDYGGYLALRALQLRPGRFACAVTIEPIAELSRLVRLRFPETDYDKFEHGLRQWYFGTDKDELREKSPATHANLVREPVFLVANPSSYRESWSELNSFRRRLAAAGNAPTFFEVTAGAAVNGAEQARLWGQIEDFLTKHLAKR